MIYLRLGFKGMGKTAATYAEVFRKRAGRVVFVVTPCFEGGTPEKEAILKAPLLECSNGVDFGKVLPIIKAKGGICRVPINSGLPFFLESLPKIKDFVLVVDDFKTVGAWPGVKNGFDALYPLTRYGCDVYITAHYFRKSFGDWKAIWREADTISIYGPPRSADELEELIREYDGDQSQAEFSEKLKANPKYSEIVIKQ